MKKSNRNALPRLVKIKATRPEITENVMYHEAYQLSLLRPISIIHRRRCFSFSPTKAFIAIRTAGKAVMMKKKEGPKDEETASGTRERGSVGKGRRVKLNEVGWEVEFRIDSSRVRSK